MTYHFYIFFNNFDIFGLMKKHVYQQVGHT